MPEKVVRKVKYTEMVPYQETIRVAVAPRARPASAAIAGTGACSAACSVAAAATRNVVVIEGLVPLAA